MFTKADVRWRTPLKGSARRDLHLIGYDGQRGRIAIVFEDGRWVAGGDNACGGWKAQGSKPDVKAAQAEALEACLVHLNLPSSTS